MQTNLYAIQIRPGQIVAAEIPADTAAILLDAGRTVLLAIEPELSQLARKLHRSLAILARRSSPQPRVSQTIPTGIRDASDRPPQSIPVWRRTAVAS